MREPANPVYSLAVQGDGKILLGGGFRTINGQSRSGIARLNADGSLEDLTTFNSGTGVDGRVYAVIVQADGKILLGGTFTQVDGQPRNGIARLEANGTVESTATFDPGTGARGTHSPGIIHGVFSIAVQRDGKILLGGDFTEVNGLPRGGIARLNADGTLEDTATFDPGAGATGWPNRVFCVALQPDGKIVLGGQFRAVAGRPRSSIARLLADGSLESRETFNPGSGADGFFPSVLSRALQADGKILVGGVYDKMGGRRRHSIARLHADGTVESIATFNPDTELIVPSVFPVIFDTGFQCLTLQANGGILFGAYKLAVVGNFDPSDYEGRYLNGPAIQRLIFPSAARIQWIRGGTAPEVEQVTFELSADGGANWSSLGPGARIAGGWEITGLSLAGSGSIRARGRTFGGQYNSSSGLVEQIAAFTPTNPSADALIAAGTSSNFAGLGIRNRTGLGQTLAVAAPVGGRKTFNVKVRNVGAATASYIVGGTAKSAGFNVRYFDETNAEITAGVVRGTYQINDLAPGTEKSLTLAITVQAPATAGIEKTCRVTAVPIGFTDAADADTVRARVVVK